MVGFAKRDQWAADLDVPTVPDYRGRRANYRSGTGTVGKRMGAVKGTGTPKRVQPTRAAARKTPGAGMPTRDVTQPPIPADQIGKGLVSKAPNNRIMLRASGQAALAGGGLLATGYGIGRLDRRGNVRMGPDDRRRKRERARRKAEVGKALPMRRGARRALEQAGSQHGASKINNAMKLTPSKRLRRGKLIQLPKRGDGDAGRMAKRDRRYDPEANRQRRLGAAATATGIGGAAAAGSGVRSIRNANRRIDQSSATLALRAKTPGQKKEAKEILEVLANRKQHGVGLVSRRSAGKIGVGAGLLAASGGISHYGRSRSNRSYR